MEIVAAKIISVKKARVAMTQSQDPAVAMTKHAVADGLALPWAPSLISPMTSAVVLLAKQTVKTTMIYVVEICFVD
jgi:hypothetical protein